MTGGPFVVALVAAGVDLERRTFEASFLLSDGSIGSARWPLDARFTAHLCVEAPPEAPGFVH